jgi:mono/diheme cytochrome c family protein
MRPIHALPVLLAAVALVGCGGGGDDSGSTSGGGGSAAPPAATQEAQQEQGGSTTTAKPKPKPPKGPDGAEVFASAGCGGCHTLAAAGTTGNVGPNLDDLQPDAPTVRSQVENGGGGMPSFSGELSPAEIDAVARYVAQNAGR